MNKEYMRWKNYMKSIYTLFITMVVVFSCVVSAYAKPLVLVTSEWRPYTSAKMKDFGMFTRMVSLVFKEMGQTPEYRFYPWGRCYDAVVKGRVWAAFPYSYTKERAKQVLFSKPLSSSRTLFFYYAPPGSHKDFQAHTIADLKKYRVGGVTGYFYEEMFKEAGLKVDYVNEEVQGIEKLILNRIDLMPMNEHVARDLIKQHFPKHVHDFKSLDYVFSVNELSLIVSKHYPQSRQWLERFNAAVKRCQEKGILPSP